jgi:hypothetical protein
MAGETINERGSFVNIQVAASTAAAAFSAGARTTIAAALTAGQESNYPLLDLQVDVSTGTIVADDVLHVYRRNKADGTNETPVPDATFKSQYMGTFLLDVGGQYFYIFGLPNDDPSATFYLENAATNTLTVALAARARTYKAAS